VPKSKREVEKENGGEKTKVLLTWSESYYLVDEMWKGQYIQKQKLTERTSLLENHGGPRKKPYHYTSNPTEGSNQYYLDCRSQSGPADCWITFQYTAHLSFSMS
jgi:hypothetical protein